VLHALDLTAWLSAGRLILLAFDPLEAALTAFLARHPGYDPPAKMLAHAGVPGAALEDARQSSEKAMSAAITRQWASARELAAALKQRVSRTPGERPRVAVFSADARPRYMAAARGLTRALAELDWPGTTLIPDSPWSCHTLTRLGAIHEHRPDFVLLLNSCAGKLAEFLPEKLPLVSWFWPGAEINPATLEGLAPHHLIMATTPEQRDQLIAAGASAARLHLLAPGVDTSIYRPVDIPVGRREALSCDVAILMDAEDCAPAALGITLESHARLWETLRQAMARHAERFRPSIASQLVEEAERASGVALGSGEVRERLIQLVRGPLARSMVTAATVSHLRSFGLTVRLWGQGWAGWEQVGEALAGPIPDQDQLPEIFQVARSVVFPCPDPWTPLCALEVCACGGTPVVSAADSPYRSSQPQLAAVLGSIPQFDRFKSLVSLLRQRILPDKTHMGGAATGPSAMLRGHSLVNRLELIWETIQDPGDG
jgi:hypothetical protein